MTITADHVRQLLAADSPEATLVIVAGQPKVTSDPAGEGGLTVTGRDDLVKDHGASPGDDELDRIAQTLNATVGQLGG